MSPLIKANVTDNNKLEIQIIVYGKWENKNIH